jgi:hypothetical protein
LSDVSSWKSGEQHGTGWAQVHFRKNACTEPFFGPFFLVLTGSYVNNMCEVADFSGIPLSVSRTCVNQPASLGPQSLMRMHAFSILSMVLGVGGGGKKMELPSMQMLLDICPS